jgi:hypothetical protein
MLPVQAVVRLMEEYSPKPDSSRVPQTIQPSPNRRDFKAQVFAKFDVWDSLFSSPPRAFVSNAKARVFDTKSRRGIF